MDHLCVKFLGTFAKGGRIEIKRYHRFEMDNFAERLVVQVQKYRAKLPHHLCTLCGDLPLTL